MSKKKLAAILVLAALTLLLAACSSNEKPIPLEEPKEQIPTAAELEAALGDVQSGPQRTTVVYFQDNAGYLVPVSCRVPVVEGVAVQTLSLMVGGGENDVTAAALNLSTVIPEGTELSVDIGAEGLAVVDLSKHAKNCPDAVSENNMVTAIVQALTEYETVQKVQILVNGEKISELPNGTVVAEPLSRGDLNMESVDQGISLKGAQKVMVYFESETAQTMVPVTRTVFSNADIETAVLEVIKGPKDGAGLATKIPEGTGLISVRKANGVVTVNLSQEFKAVLENDDGGRAAVKALVLTCSQFPDVKEVKLQVDGKAFELDQTTMAAATYINSQEEVLLTSIFEDE